MADTKADYVAAKLRAKRWKQADLVRETGLDKNTISDFMTGKRKASLDTLGKIEDALDLTRGTLAALGEEPEPGFVRAAASDRTIGHADEEELLVELTYRMRQLKREIARLREPADEMLQLRARRDQFLNEHADDSEYLRSLRDKIMSLVFKSEAEGLGVDDESEWSRLWDLVHLEMLRADYPLAVRAIGSSEDDEGPGVGPPSTPQQPTAGGEVVTFPAGHGARPLDWDEEQAGHLQINPFAKPEPEQPQNVTKKRVPRPRRRVPQPQEEAARRDEEHK